MCNEEWTETRATLDTRHRTNEDTHTHTHKTNKQMQNKTKITQN